MRVLANPIILRAAVVLFCSTFAFLLGLIMHAPAAQEHHRRCRNFSAGPTPTLETLPLHLFNTVIQQLKQQKHELQVQSQAEQHRARTSETLNQAVLSNLSCGVLVFGTNGLVKTSNPAAKTILGFASPTGMSAEDIFRGAVISSAGQTASAPSPASAWTNSPMNSVCLADEDRRRACAKAASAVRSKPNTKLRRAKSVSRGHGLSGSAEDGSLLGVACVIDDRSELERIRRHRNCTAKFPREALQLRTSLATISGYAQQLASSRDPELAVQLAGDIAHEAHNWIAALEDF